MEKLRNELRLNQHNRKNGMNIVDNMDGEKNAEKNPLKSKG